MVTIPHSTSSRVKGIIVPHLRPKNPSPRESSKALANRPGYIGNPRQLQMCSTIAPQPIADMFSTRRGSTTIVGFQTHHGKMNLRGTRTQYSQERSTTTLPRPAIQTTAFSQLVAEATSRRSVGKLTTPTRAHRDLQLKPHTSHHVCDVYCKGYVTSRHSHFDGRD